MTARWWGRVLHEVGDEGGATVFDVVEKVGWDRFLTFWVSTFGNLCTLPSFSDVLTLGSVWRALTVEVVSRAV